MEVPVEEAFPAAAAVFPLFLSVSAVPELRSLGVEVVVLAWRRSPFPRASGARREGVREGQPTD